MNLNEYGLPYWSAQLEQVAIVMVERIALVVENHGHAVLFSKRLPLRQTFDIRIARLYKRQPDAANQLLELICRRRRACHLALKVNVVQHERKFHSV